MNANIELNKLPAEVQNKVKKFLRAYNEVNVIYEYGEYHVGTGISLKAQYAADHVFVGTYKAKEVYTADERIINYVESFHEFPIEYKGKRDYKWLDTLTWESKVKFDGNRNLVNA